MLDAVIIKGKGQSCNKIPRYKDIIRPFSYEIWTLNDDLTDDTARHFDIHLDGRNAVSVDLLWPNLAKARVCYIHPDAKLNRPYQVHYPLDEVKRLASPESFSLLSTIYH